MLGNLWTPCPHRLGFVQREPTQKFAMNLKLSKDYALMELFSRFSGAGLRLNHVTPSISINNPSHTHIPTEACPQRSNKSKPHTQ